MKKLFLTMLAAICFGAVCHAENEEKTPNGVEAVDMGLSVKWANMNVGAEKDSGFGTYFAWGETKPKQYYSWNTYTWSKGDTQFLIKYSLNDRKAQLEPSDDAVRANWGGEWRMHMGMDDKGWRKRL